MHADRKSCHACIRSLCSGMTAFPFRLFLLVLSRLLSSLSFVRRRIRVEKTAFIPHRSFVSSFFFWPRFFARTLLRSAVVAVFSSRPSVSPPFSFFPPPLFARFAAGGDLEHRLLLRRPLKALFSSPGFFPLLLLSFLLSCFLECFLS